MRKRTCPKFRARGEVVKVDTFVGAVKSISVQIKPGKHVRIEATYRRQAIRACHTSLIAQMILRESIQSIIGATHKRRSKHFIFQYFSATVGVVEHWSGADALACPPPAEMDNCEVAH
jgi:hypothetical protein